MQDFVVSLHKLAYIRHSSAHCGRQTASRIINFTPAFITMARINPFYDASQLEINDDRENPESNSLSHERTEIVALLRFQTFQLRTYIDEVSSSAQVWLVGAAMRRRAFASLKLNSWTRWIRLPVKWKTKSFETRVPPTTIVERHCRTSKTPLT